MESKTVGSDPINAIESVNHHGSVVEIRTSSSLTKREYFAAIIMAGFSANVNPASNAANAKGAVYAADALITALNANQ